MRIPVVDDLQQVVEELLLERCVYNILINFNSGEIRTGSIHNPFLEELHTSDKLINHAYVERHFPAISYAEKTAIIISIYQFLSERKYCTRLPEYNQNIISRFYQQWQSISETETSLVVGQLTKLRTIQKFYIRNFSIGMIQDAIRIQFNCDGTHIVSAVDDQRFLTDNLDDNIMQN